jgi:hypothetical protein
MYLIHWLAPSPLRRGMFYVMSAHYMEHLMYLLHVLSYTGETLDRVYTSIYLLKQQILGNVQKRFN